MNIYISRASVTAGDDIAAPHAKNLSVPDGTSLEEIVKSIAKSGYLPSISGGEASWSVTSNVPLAIVAEQWHEPRMLPHLPTNEHLDLEQGTLRVYFNYHAQIDPELLYRVFWGFHLKAI